MAKRGASPPRGGGFVADEEKSHAASVNSVSSFDTDGFGNSGLTQHTRRFAVRAAVVASNGGLLFGYDIGIAAGALPVLHDAGYTDYELEMVVALLIAGGVVGAVFAGFITDRFGRWKAIMLTCLLFIAGAIVLASANSKGKVYFGRFVVGFAVSTSAVADVSFLTEVAPLPVRGAMVGANELAVSIGVLMSYSVGYALVDQPGGWRLMFGLSGVLAAVQAVAMLWMPESPRWLVAKGRKDAARAVLATIYDVPRDADGEMRHIEKAVAAAAAGSASTTALLTSWGRQLALALVLMVVQQATANANVLNYAPEILQHGGVASRRATYGATVFLGVVKVLMTALAISRVDEAGRRPLLLGGSLVIVFALSALGLSLSLAGSVKSTPIGAALALASCTVVVAAYAASFGPVTWLVVSEMFPDALRGRAMGAALAGNWLAQLAVSGCFLTLLHNIGGGAFMVFAALSAVGFVVLWVYVPETRGRECQEIATDVRRRCGPCRCCQRRRGREGIRLGAWIQVNDNADPAASASAAGGGGGTSNSQRASSLSARGRGQLAASELPNERQRIQYTLSFDSDCDDGSVDKSIASDGGSRGENGGGRRLDLV